MLRISVWAAFAIGTVAVSSASATEAFVGRWAAKQELCSALVATDTSLWWFEGYCRIGKMYKAKAVYVQAHCGGNDVGVTLDAQGNRMRVTWGKAKAEELQRCP